MDSKMTLAIDFRARTVASLAIYSGSASMPSKKRPSQKPLILENPESFFWDAGTTATFVAKYISRTAVTSLTPEERAFCKQALNNFPTMFPCIFDPKQDCGKQGRFCTNCSSRQRMEREILGELGELDR